MADGENEQHHQVRGNKSILDQVANQLKEQKRKECSAKIKSLLVDLLKAKEVVAGIENQIIEELESVGESEADVKSILASV